MNNIAKKIRQLAAGVEDRLSDYRYGINTQGFISKEFLRTTSSYRDNASAYQRVWSSSLMTIINAGRRSGFENCMFLDIGCGKGKACFYAANTLYFNEVVGFDFDEHLIDSARENLKSYRGRGKGRIKFLLHDAADYKLADVKTFVFMFNPFDSVVLELFLKNNLDVIKRNCIVADAYDIKRNVLIDFGMECIFRDAMRQLSLWRFKVSGL